jgi:hypothetical protein
VNVTYIVNGIIYVHFLFVWNLHMIYGKTLFCMAVIGY